jgi:hypothetical protein
MYVGPLQIVFPPGAIWVLLRPPTPVFFLYKNPGNPIEPPNQKLPLLGI